MIVGYKSPGLARELSERLAAAGIEHVQSSEFLDRSAFLALLGESRTVVCLPHEREGFYLPALEAMASGCLLVTLDCIGNRGFCLHEENCLIADHNPDSLLRTVQRAAAMPAWERRRVHQRAAETVAEHSLEVERRRFHAILGDIDRIWSAAKADASPASWRSVVPPPPAKHRPRLDFMIVGAQKCGTSALAHFLSQHPEIGMASPKEVHLFDRPGYSSDWTPEQIDDHYGSQLGHCTGARILGEATPSYMFVPEIGRDLARYNPDLKLIVLLRDPVERAISHYYMEKGRGRERRPLWFALLREPYTGATPPRVHVRREPPSRPQASEGARWGRDHPRRLLRRQSRGALGGHGPELPCAFIPVPGRSGRALPPDAGGGQVPDCRGRT